MNKASPVHFALLGIAIFVAGILLKKYPLFDPLANLDFAYLAGMLGIVMLVVGMHCVLFSCSPVELPARPNLALYVLVASAANVNIIWDGIALEYPNEAVTGQVKTGHCRAG